MKILATIGILAGAILIAFLWWGRPTEEDRVRRVVDRMVAVFQYTQRPGNIRAAAAANQVASQFSNDAVVRVEVPGEGRRNLDGRGEIRQSVLGVLTRVDRLRVQLVDSEVAIEDDSGTASLRGSFKIYRGSAEVPSVVEIRFGLGRDSDSGWVVDRVETVRTLTL